MNRKSSPKRTEVDKPNQRVMSLQGLDDISIVKDHHLSRQVLDMLVCLHVARMKNPKMKRSHMSKKKRSLTQKMKRATCQRRKEAS